VAAPAPEDSPEIGQHRRVLRVFSLKHRWECRKVGEFMEGDMKTKKQKADLEQAFWPVLNPLFLLA
jgi:hypothetical protein